MSTFVTKDEFDAMLQVALAGFGEQFAGKLGEIAKASSDGIASLRNEVAEGLAKSPLGINSADLAKFVSGQFARHDAASDGSARREFVANKLKDVPATYASGLGTDPENFEAEARAIRESYQADLKTAGVMSPAPARDLSTLSAEQLVLQGAVETAAAVKK